MPERRKKNVPSRGPPPQNPNFLYPPSNNRYPEGDEDRSNNLYDGYDEHGFLRSEDSAQPDAAESHPQGNTTRSRPQSYGTPHHLHPFDTAHHPQQDPLERPPPTPTPYRSSYLDGDATPRALAGTEPRHGTGEPSGATHRSTDRNRHSDKPAESKDSTVAVTNQNTGTRRSRRDNERRSDRTAEN